MTSDPIESDTQPDQPERYVPRNLRAWKRPDSYAGAQWDGWYAAPVGRSRDSDTLELSNFDAQWGALEPFESGPEVEDPTEYDSDDAQCAPVRIVRESHWAVGWVEWVAIHSSATDALRAADELARRLENYPILDESDFSEKETESQAQDWESYARDEFRRALESRHGFDLENVSDDDIDTLAHESGVNWEGESFDTERAASAIETDALRAVAGAVENEDAELDRAAADRRDLEKTFERSARYAGHRPIFHPHNGSDPRGSNWVLRQGHRATSTIQCADCARTGYVNSRPIAPGYPTHGGAIFEVHCKSGRTIGPDTCAQCGNLRTEPRGNCTRAYGHPRDAQGAESGAQP